MAAVLLDRADEGMRARHGGLPSESLPSESLPSESLPSECLPSESLPSESLPSESLPSESAAPPCVSCGARIGAAAANNKNKITYNNKNVREAAGAESMGVRVRVIGGEYSVLESWRDTFKLEPTILDW